MCGGRREGACTSLGPSRGSLGPVSLVGEGAPRIESSPPGTLGKRWCPQRVGRKRVPGAARRGPEGVQLRAAAFLALGCPWGVDGWWGAAGEWRVAGATGNLEEACNPAFTYLFIFSVDSPPFPPEDSKRSTPGPGLERRKAPSGPRSLIEPRAPGWWSVVEREGLCFRPLWKRSC